jgi:hypothetical protein
MWQIGHSSNDCIDGRRSGGDNQAYNDRYGQWLRAVPGRQGLPRTHHEPRMHGEVPEASPSWKGSMGSRGGGHHASEGAMRRWRRKTMLPHLRESQKIDYT